MTVLKSLSRRLGFLSTADPEPSGDTIPGDERYRRWTLSQLQKIEAVLSQNGDSIQQFSSILDFGCGFSRLTQFLFELVPSAKVFGCEVRSDLIAKCRKRYPRGHFLTNLPVPPLDFPDEQFDFIFSFSVFTHLSEPNHIAWLKELARKLKPGGVMLHTTHGYECLKRLAVFNPENLAKYELLKSLEEFTSKLHRYHYVVDNPSTPEYGMTIISKEYILTKWPLYSGMTLVDYAEGVIEVNPEGCHDIVILVKDR